VPFALIAQLAESCVQSTYLKFVFIEINLFRFNNVRHRQFSSDKRFESCKNCDQLWSFVYRCSQLIAGTVGYSSTTEIKTEFCFQRYIPQELIKGIAFFICYFILCPAAALMVAVPHPNPANLWTSTGKKGLVHDFASICNIMMTAVADCVYNLSLPIFVFADSSDKANGD